MWSVDEFSGSNCALTHLCSCNVACISVNRTNDLADFSSAEILQHWMLPIICASSANFCACNLKEEY